ncbi:MAG TPA: phasin family protein [Candidatus Dormibacteraeota bacterium]|nr:phasin family protein [Candidatus Dormibacteraeota bacterium]
MAAESAVSAAVLRQAETWSKAQCELLSGIGQMWGRVLQWQREAVEASGRSLTQIAEARDVGNIMQVQQQWFEGAVRRTTSNWSELANDAATLTWRVTRVDHKADHPQSPAPTTRSQGAEKERPLREAAK